MVSASLRYARTLLLITLLLICFHDAQAQYIDGTDRHASMICSDGSVYSWGWRWRGGSPNLIIPSRRESSKFSYIHNDSTDFLIKRFFG